MNKFIFALFLIGSSTLVQAQTDYGNEFDKLEKKRISMSDDEKFDSILPYFQSRNLKEEHCIELIRLVKKNHYDATMYALSIVGTTHQSNLQSCGGLGNFIGLLYDAADRIPQIYDSADDLWANARIGTYSSFYSRRLSQAKLKAVNEKSLEYISRAASLGNDMAQLHLAKEELKQGEKKKAFINLNKAAEQGNHEALNLLDSEFGYEFQNFRYKPDTLMGMSQRSNEAIKELERLQAINAKKKAEEKAEKDKARRIALERQAKLIEEHDAKVTSSRTTKTSSVVRMGMFECKASIFTVARNRGVIPQTVMNTDISYMARIPVSPNNWNTYDLYTCSKLDGIRGIKRVNR